MKVLSDLEIYTLTRALNRQTPLKGFFKKTISISIILHPKILLSEEFINLGHGFLKACSDGIFKIVLTKDLLDEYSQEVHLMIKRGYPMFAGLHKFLEDAKMVKRNFNFNSFSDLTKAQKLLTYLNQVLFVFPDEYSIQDCQETINKPEHPYLIRFSELMNDINEV